MTFLYLLKIEQISLFSWFISTKWSKLIIKNKFSRKESSVNRYFHKNLLISKICKKNLLTLLFWFLQWQNVFHDNLTFFQNYCLKHFNFVMVLYLLMIHNQRTFMKTYFHSKHSNFVMVLYLLMIYNNGTYMKNYFYLKHSNFVVLYLLMNNN